MIIRCDMEVLPDSAEWRKKLRNSFICYLLIGIFIGIDYSVIGCTLYLYLRDILKSKVPEIWYGTIISVYFLTSFLLRAFGKRQFKNTHRIKVFVRAALVTQAVGYMFYAIPYHPLMLLISRIICSVSEPLDSIIYKEINVTYNHMCRARALSWYSSLKYTGMILGPALTVAIFGISLNDVELDVTQSNFIGIFMVLLYILLLFMSLYLVHDCSHDIEQNGEVIVTINSVIELEGVEDTPKNIIRSINGAPIAKVDRDHIFDNDGVIVNEYTEMKSHGNCEAEKVEVKDTNATGFEKECNDTNEEKDKTESNNETNGAVENEIEESVEKEDLDILIDNAHQNYTVQILDSIDNKSIEKEEENIETVNDQACENEEDVKDYVEHRDSVLSKSQEIEEEKKDQLTNQVNRADLSIENKIRATPENQDIHVINGNTDINNGQSSSNNENPMKDTFKETTTKNDKEFMRQIFNGETLTRLISSQPVISSQKLFRLIVSNRSLFLVFISSFLSTYVLITFIVFTPILTLGLLNWNIATLSIILVSSGAFASISCDLIGRYFKTQRYIYIKNLVCIIMQIISCCILIGLRLLQRYYTRDVALVVVYAIAVTLAWCLQRNVLTTFLKSLMPADLEGAAESLRLLLCRNGMVLGAFSVGFLVPCLHVWSAVLVMFLGLLLFGFIIQMKTFIAPRELSLER